MKSPTLKTQKNILRILEFLKTEEGDVHIRGISRRLGIHPQTVDRIIDNYIFPFLDINNIIFHGFRAKLVKLKEEKRNITLLDVMKYYKIRRMIKGNT